MGIAIDARRLAARNRRYKKAAVSGLELECMKNDIYEMNDVCEDFAAELRDCDELLEGLDGDEEELHEFELMFSDVQYDLERLLDRIYNDEIWLEDFNEVFAGIASRRMQTDMYGYDDYEEDWFPIDTYEAERAQEAAHKRLMAKTKKEILNAQSLCFEFAFTYISVKQKYDNLIAAYEILRGVSKEHLELLKDIDRAYEAADADDWYEYGEPVIRFERLLRSLPDVAWVE